MATGVVGCIAREEFEASRCWGLSTSIDIYDCDANTIRDAEAIRQFTKEMCQLLKVKAYGETTIVEFGDDPRVHGYSMVQLIETSLVSAHFAEDTNTVYLDVFSCKYYDPVEAIEYARAFFQGERVEVHTLLRR